MTKECITIGNYKIQIGISFFWIFEGPSIILASKQLTCFTANKNAEDISVKFRYGAFDTVGDKKVTLWPRWVILLTNDKTESLCNIPEIDQ